MLGLRSETTDQTATEIPVFMSITYVVSTLYQTYISKSGEKQTKNPHYFVVTFSKDKLIKFFSSLVEERSYYHR